jgi:hypothetical protein
VGDFVGLMRYFQCMSKALIFCLDRDEARALAPHEGPPRSSVNTVNIHCELEKVKFPSSLVPRMVQPLRHGWRNMAM